MRAMMKSGYGGHGNVSKWLVTGTIKNWKEDKKIVNKKDDGGQRWVFIWLLLG